MLKGFYDRLMLTDGNRRLWTEKNGSVELSRPRIWRSLEPRSE